MLRGMVGAAHQRTRFHMAKAHREAQFLEHLELIRMCIAIDGQVVFRGLEILSQRQDVTFRLSTSSITWITSSVFSPIPSMRPVFVTAPYLFDLSRTSSDC